MTNEEAVRDYAVWLDKIMPNMVYEYVEDLETYYTEKAKKAKKKGLGQRTGKPMGEGEKEIRMNDERFRRSIERGLG